MKCPKCGKKAEYYGAIYYYCLKCYVGFSIPSYYPTNYAKVRLLKLAQEMIHDGDDYVLDYGKKLMAILENQSSPKVIK